MIFMGKFVYLSSENANVVLIVKKVGKMNIITLWLWENKVY